MPGLEPDSSHNTLTTRTKICTICFQTHLYLCKRQMRR